VGKILINNQTYDAECARDINPSVHHTADMLKNSPEQCITSQQEAPLLHNTMQQ